MIQSCSGDDSKKAEQMPQEKVLKREAPHETMTDEKHLIQSTDQLVQFTPGLNQKCWNGYGIKVEVRTTAHRVSRVKDESARNFNWYLKDLEYSFSSQHQFQTLY